MDHDHEFLQQILNYGVSHEGYEAHEFSYSYQSLLEDVAKDFELYEFMMLSSTQWLDLGYLQYETLITDKNSTVFCFTSKVYEDKPVLIRMMEKHYEQNPKIIQSSPENGED